MIWTDGLETEAPRRFVHNIRMVPHFWITHVNIWTGVVATITPHICVVRLGVMESHATTQRTLLQMLLPMLLQMIQWHAGWGHAAGAWVWPYSLVHWPEQECPFAGHLGWNHVHSMIVVRTVWRLASADDRKGKINFGQSKLMTVRLGREVQHSI